MDPLATAPFQAIAQTAAQQPVLSPIQPQQTPVASNSAPTQPSIASQGGLDPQAVALSQAIRQTESGGNFQAQGASGEYGAYQWLPATWDKMSAAAGVNVPLEQATPEQQNQVAYTQVKAWKDQGYNPGQIASMWNAGPGDPNAYLTGNSGTNAEGVQYDTQAYAQKVATAYQQFKQQTQPQTSTPTQQGSPSVEGFLGNVVQSGANFAGNLVNAVAHPITTAQNVLETGAGALDELGGQTNDDTAKFDALKNYFIQKYGGVSNIEHTLYTDPISVAADLSAVFGGAGLAANVGGKLAEFGGLADAADVANSVGSGLGKVSELTNPLTPLVKAGGAALNSTKSLSDVIANPDTYTPEMIANSSAEKVTQDVQEALETRRNELSETGAGYTPFREAPTPITTDPASLDNILRDSLKVNVTDGVIEPNSTSVLRDQPSINKLQAVYNTYKPDFLNGTMDSEKLLNLRSDLGKIAYNDLGIKNSDVATQAARVRGAVNTAFRSQVPGLSDLDSNYESQINKLNELQDGLIYKTGSNKGELKTSFINSSLRAVKNGDSDKLAQLEEVMPGITKRLQVMKTLKDLGSENFTTLAEKGGVVGGLITGNLKGAAFALSSIILSKPEIAIPLLRAVGANMELVKSVMANLAKSLNVGAVQNNVQEASQQTPEQLTATPQDQSTTTSQEAQSGNPSDLTQLAANHHFDLQAATKAGYSPQEIEQFLQTQQ